MPFIGLRMGSLRLPIYLISFAWLFSLHAEDFAINMPDQLQGDDRPLEKVTEEDEDKENFGGIIMGTAPEMDLSKIKESEDGGFAIPSSGKKDDRPLSEKEKILSFGNDVPYQYEDRESLIEFKNEDIFKKIYNKGDSSFSFFYLKDTYTVDDPRNIYESSFEQATGSVRGGYLHITFDQYWTRNFVNTFYGFGAGAGYAQGKGLFVNSPGEESSVKFQLFTIPLDLRLGMDIVLGRPLKLSLVTGPSVMGLLQSRSDRDDGEKDKHRRQVSYGYFAHGRLQISMSYFSDALAFKTFSESNLTNMFINLEARLQSYENFQEDISVTGASFGIGFSFEYL